MDVLASRKTGEPLHIPLATLGGVAIISAGLGIPTLAIPELEVSMPALAVASARRDHACRTSMPCWNAVMNSSRTVAGCIGFVFRVWRTGRPMAASQAA